MVTEAKNLAMLSTLTTQVIPANTRSYHDNSCSCGCNLFSGLGSGGGRFPKINFFNPCGFCKDTCLNEMITTSNIQRVGIAAIPEEIHLLVGNVCNTSVTWQNVLKHKGQNHMSRHFCFFLRKSHGHEILPDLSHNKWQFLWHSKQDPSNKFFGRMFWFPVANSEFPKSPTTLITKWKYSWHINKNIHWESKLALQIKKHYRATLSIFSSLLGTTWSQAKLAFDFSDFTNMRKATAWRCDHGDRCLNLIV